jgi:predicted DNA-binding protein
MARSEQASSTKVATERLTFSLAQSARTKLRRIADLEKRSEAWIVREAVELFINNYKLPPEQPGLNFESTNE